MSVLALSGLPQLLERESRASSEDSRTVHGEIQKTKRYVRSIASSMQSQAYAALEDVVARCSYPDWDGHGARPISSLTKAWAELFLDALPMSLPTPEIVPEADGEVAIEWDIGTDRIFSVSIGDTGLLHFAGLFGGGIERHGVEPFDGLVPSEILAYIGRLYWPRRRAA